MLRSLRKRCLRGSLALSLAVLLAASPLATVTSYASSATAQGTWTGSTTDWANVRTGPGTNYATDTIYAPGTSVTVYETVSGESLWAGSTWYRIGNGIYIYGGLITQSSGSNNSSSSASSSRSSSGSTGTTTGWANVRTGPGTSYATNTTYAPGTRVTIYESVSGEAGWSGPTWYRISANPSLYIYGGLVSVSSGSSNSPSSSSGKEIVVSLSGQSLTAYENGNKVYNTPVTTGRPELPTPTGTYHILSKQTNVEFKSPWPVGSPYYYATVRVPQAMEFDPDGYYLHSAPWRGTYGPGTNNWHDDSLMGWTTGTHGCVNLPMAAENWVFNWAPVGTTVQVNT